MQVELIGCTSAGKSTLTKQILERSQAQGIKLSTSYDFVLGYYRLGWVKPHSLRMLVLNNLALWRCVQSAGKHWPVLRLVFRILRTLPPTVSQRERLKIARITLRNLGIHEIITQAGSTDEIILADEGAIQVIHYLFVHLSSAPALEQLAAYLQRAPLPDLILYYRQPAELLIARTLQRGHKRLPERTPAKVEQFIDHALCVFETAVAEPRICQRTLIVDGRDHQVAYNAHSADSSSQPEPRAQKLADIMASLVQEEGAVSQPERCKSSSV